MNRRTWIAAGLLAALVAAGLVTAQNRPQWPADTVFFSDLDTLQQKLDEGSLGGGPVAKTGTTVHPISSSADSLATGSTDCATAEFCAQPSGATRVGVLTSVNPSSATGGSLTLAESTAAGAHKWTLQAPADLTADATCAIGADGSLGCASSASPLARSRYFYHDSNVDLSATANVCGAFDWADDTPAGGLAGITYGTGTLTVANPGTYEVEAFFVATINYSAVGHFTRQHWTVDDLWIGSEAFVGVPGTSLLASRANQNRAAARFVVAGAPVVLRLCTGDTLASSTLVAGRSIGSYSTFRIQRIDP